VPEFFEAVEASREEYYRSVLPMMEICAQAHIVFREYVPELDRARAAREKSLNAVKAESMNRLMKDLAVDRQDPDFAAQDRWDPDAEDEEDEDDGGEETIIDRCTFIFPSWSSLTDVFGVLSGGTLAGPVHRRDAHAIWNAG
jgi:hypothetical protein